MEHALCYGPVQFRLREAQGRLRSLLVAARNRGFDFLDEGAHSTRARSVDRRALGGLTDALFR